MRGWLHLVKCRKRTCVVARLDGKRTSTNSPFAASQVQLDKGQNEIVKGSPRIRLKITKTPRRACFFCKQAPVFALPDVPSGTIHCKKVHDSWGVRML